MAGLLVATFQKWLFNDAYLDPVDFDAKGQSQQSVPNNRFSRSLRGQLGLRVTRIVPDRHYLWLNE
jgi:hypothetical protein